MCLQTFSLQSLFCQCPHHHIHSKRMYCTRIQYKYVRFHYKFCFFGPCRVCVNSYKALSFFFGSSWSLITTKRKREREVMMNQTREKKWREREKRKNESNITFFSYFFFFNPFLLSHISAYHSQSIFHSIFCLLYILVISFPCFLSKHIISQLFSPFLVSLFPSLCLSVFLSLSRFFLFSLFPFGPSRSGPERKSSLRVVGRSGHHDAGSKEGRVGWYDLDDEMTMTAAMTTTMTATSTTTATAAAMKTT